MFFIGGELINLVNFLGPGCSSIGGGAFTELDPFYPSGDGCGLRRNSKSWNTGMYMTMILNSPSSPKSCFHVVIISVSVRSRLDKANFKTRLLVLKNLFDRSTIRSRSNDHRHGD